MDMIGLLDLAKETMGLFKSTTEVIKGIRDIAASGKPDSKQLVDSAIETLRDKMTELQDKHLALQHIALTTTQNNIAIVEENRALKEKLAQLDKFDAARDLFERVPMALNTSAYREKTFQGAAEAQPLFCPQCFDNSKKTYLSFQEHAMHTKLMKCTFCGTNVHVPRDDGPSVIMTARVKTRYDVFGDDD